MSNGQPKLMLKVELKKDTDVKITVLQMTDVYTKHDFSSKFLFTDNNWTIYQGQNFIMTKKNVICLPNTALRQETKLFFKNDKERYEYMKGLATALKFWSKSHFFKGNTNKTKLNFHKSIWVIF